MRCSDAVACLEGGTIAVLMHEHVIWDSSLLQLVLCLDQERSWEGASHQPRPGAPAARLIEVSRRGISLVCQFFCMPAIARDAQKGLPIFGNPNVRGYLRQGSIGQPSGS